MPVVTANSNMNPLHAGLKPEIKNSFKVRSLITFSCVVYPGNHRGLQKNDAGGRVGLFPVVAGGAREEKEEKYMLYHQKKRS